MIAPSWLVDALEQCDSRSLDNVEDRMAVASAICEALEHQQAAMLASIRSSLATQLEAESDGLTWISTRAAAIDRVARNVTTSAIGALEKVI